MRRVNVVWLTDNCTLIEMTDRIDFPPELQHVADLLSEASSEVFEFFYYALVLAMIDNEKMHVISTLHQGNTNI